MRWGDMPALGPCYGDGRGTNVSDLKQVGGTAGRDDACDDDMAQDVSEVGRAAMAGGVS